MDDLSITPEELNNILGGDETQESSDAPKPADTADSGSSGGTLSQDDINRLLAEQTGGPPPAVPVTPQISPDELNKITGAAPVAPTPSPAPAPASAATAAASAGSTARPAQFAPLQPSNGTPANTNLDMLLGVNLKVTVELGRTRMTIEEILQLGPGSVVELDKLAGEPVDVLINDRLIARGEVVVIDDRFGVRITDVVPPAQRVHSMQ